MRGLRQDTLFVACTRPAISFGLPHEALIIFMVVGSEAWITIHRPFIIGPILLLTYAALWCLTAYDPHIFHAVFLWLRTNGACSINSDHWGSASMSPTPVRKLKRGQGIVVHA
jgi:type IV secretion system protein VirB3